MTVRETADKFGLTEFACSDPDREVRDGYAGDLLSWVMGRAKSGQIWLTIMSNRNIVAVAELTDVALIVLCEGVEPDAGVAELAKSRGINLFGTAESVFSLAAKLGGTV